MEGTQRRDLSNINAEGAHVTLGWFCWVRKVTLQNKSIHNFSLSLF